MRGRLGSIVPPSMQRTARRLSEAVRRSSIFDVYEKAKVRGAEMQRKRWAQVLFEYSFYFFLLAFVYLVLVGLPLWKGAVYWMYWLAKTKFNVTAGFTITLGIALVYAYAPLFVLFERDPPPAPEVPNTDPATNPTIRKTALLIPCYKSASIVGATLEAAIKVFPPSHIFVISNGNSPTPLDNTEEVCEPYGVTQLWSPIGSKIVAQFVGFYAAKDFDDVLLIDDDCTLPPNFPVVGDRLVGKGKSIGYTIKSVGPNASRGNYCQQAQDFEYKISGLQRAFAGVIGSATFPHGAISLWDREFLIEIFHDHPGFSVSEDWFFGHSCRRLGGRIQMCSAVFVETETPPAVFFSTGGSRGGFGEMTVFKQRFLRWNFFFVNGICLHSAYLFSATLALYLINSIIFNEVHLRLKNERVGWGVLLIYYMPYKVILTAVNVASCYWAIFKYGRYFANRHPKVIEDENAVEIVLRLEETTEKETAAPGDTIRAPSQGRRMTVTSVITKMSVSGDIPVPSPLLPRNQSRDKAAERRSKGISIQFADLPRHGSVANRFSQMYGPKQEV
ncbi:hypothetical protein QQX98_004123 [Neonectria punicea]|uniref:Glycosyltransferase 2-like domain-containing protein n=1 Tax=Neonectria punicea TaxID=979145 RepID=A0ABR1HAH5_9HYPO